jgi:hypothetical protein
MDLTKNQLKKIIAVSLIFILLSTVIFPNVSSIPTKSSDDYDEIKKIIDESVLDLQYIYNLTAALSNIIFTEYDEEAGELAKGRYFGSKGEHKAAEILYENLTKLGLYTTKERLYNTPEQPYLTRIIDVDEAGLYIYEKDSDKKNNKIEGFISPNWDFTGLHYGFSFVLNNLNNSKPIMGPFLAKLFSFLIPRQNGLIDKKLNFYSNEKITDNFSYNGLKVIRKPTTYSKARDLARRLRYREPFVFIDKDPGFTTWTYEKPKCRGFFYKFMQENVPYYEDILWRLWYPNCKAIILYDSNYDSFNAVAPRFNPNHIIRVNRTVGEKIFENPEKYLVDFYIKQSVNESVESYNVIGQLNGTNPDETVIVCSLYDSWWCQGTGDSAIGMSLVLGVAKYFVDNNIIPKCNVKFIGFGGEECGGAGAYHYEETHRDENISYLIDINQVGFKAVYPENLGFFIWPSNASLLPTLWDFGRESNFTERTGVRFTALHKSFGGMSNSNIFAMANNTGKRSCNTLCFIKTGFNVPESKALWQHHHRDGEGHTEGDVLKYFNWHEVSVTGEMYLNATKYFTI